MERAMLRWTSVVFFFFGFLSHAQLGAQVTPSRMAPKFTSKSQLVLVPVVVMGKDGQHISGLKRDAFRIEEHGKTREATIFEEIKTVAPDANSRRAPAVEGHSNFNYADAQNWRMTVVVLDMLNTPFLSQNEAKRQLIQYLSKSLQREEPTALFGLRLSGLKQLHPFTTDTAVLIEALKKAQNEMGLDESNQATANWSQDLTDTLADNSAAWGHDSETAQQILNFMMDAETSANNKEQRDSIRTTLTAMTQIAHACEAIPGRKTMIWASGGFPFMIDDPQAFARMGIDMVAQYEETWRALVAADIAVYTVDVNELTGFYGMANFDASQHSTSALRAGRSDSSRVPHLPYNQDAQKQETLKAFAEATGGLPCANTNDLARCFARAVDDSRSYYLLGYYLPADDQRAGWRTLKVKVEASGARVRARKGFYVPSPADDTPEARGRQIVDALQSPVEFTGVRMNVRELPLADNAKTAGAGKSKHEFAVGVLGNSLTVDGNAVDVTALGVAFAADGNNCGQAENHLAGNLKPEVLEKIRKSGMAMNVSLELAPGKYDVHFAVRNNVSGEVGSVNYPLEVK